MTFHIIYGRNFILPFSSPQFHFCLAHNPPHFVLILREQETNPVVILFDKRLFLWYNKVKNRGTSFFLREKNREMNITMFYLIQKIAVAILPL